MSEQTQTRTIVVRPDYEVTIDSLDRIPEQDRHWCDACQRLIQHTEIVDGEMRLHGEAIGYEDSGGCTCTDCMD